MFYLIKVHFTGEYCKSYQEIVVKGAKITSRECNSLLSRYNSKLPSKYIPLIG